jgi:hypothetical protein
LIFELLASKVRSETLETGVISEDPTVHVLGIPKRMPGKPLDAELGMRTAGQIYQVKQSQNGTMRSPYNGDGQWRVSGKVGCEFTGLQNNVKVQPLKVVPRNRDRSSCR